MILLVNYLMYKVIQSADKKLTGINKPNRRINQIHLFSSQYPSTVYLELLSTSFVTITGC